MRGIIIKSIAKKKELAQKGINNKQPTIQHNVPWKHSDSAKQQTSTTKTKKKEQRHRFVLL